MLQTNSILNENGTVTLTEAAEILGITYGTAWRWTKEGRFDGVTRTLSGHVHIPRASVEAVLAAGPKRRGRGARRG